MTTTSDPRLRERLAIDDQVEQYKTALRSSTDVMIERMAQEYRAQVEQRMKQRLEEVRRALEATPTSTIIGRVVDLLSHMPDGLTARQLSAALEVDYATIRTTLYGNKDRFSRANTTTAGRQVIWRLRKDPPEEDTLER